MQQEILRDLTEAKKISDDVSKIIEESLNEIVKLIENKDKTLTQRVCDALNEVVEDYNFDLSGDTSICNEEGEIKWYDSIEDLKKVSALVPEALIQVDGEGEESGDIWRSYYKGGKYQMVKTEIVYEDFDESKLT